jgi:hypothetical protein
MPMLQFVGQSARDSDNIAAAPSRLLNCYREPTAEGAFVLKPVPGLTAFATLGAVFVRAMATVSGKLFAASSGDLVEVFADGTVISHGEIGDGFTTLAGNNGTVTACVGGRYWTWDGTALAEPSAGAFSDFGAVEYFGNYTVLTERNGRMFQWSDIADPSDLPGLNFSTADGRDDNILRPFVINGRLYLWKETSHEVWYLTGGAGADAFARVAGGVQDVGLKAAGLICGVSGGAFIVGSDDRAYLVSNGALRPVSTTPVETAIKQGTPASCVAYDDEGHTFCVITFGDRPAWAFDITMNEWHERSEGISHAPWSVSATVKWDGAWYAGRNDGMLFLFGGVADGAVPVTKEVTSTTLRMPDRGSIHDLEAFPRKGLEESSLTLALSRDEGLTWGAEKVRSVGPIGSTGHRVNWRNLGQFRNATARLRWDGAFSVRADVLVVVT